ncbi:MAG TPA: hypothetical protein VIP11_26950 [Gemmatimonadaceae bacterium]
MCIFANRAQWSFIRFLYRVRITRLPIQLIANILASLGHDADPTRGRQFFHVARDM